MVNDLQTEFFKLDSIDKKILFWMMDHRPDDIFVWLSHLVKQYNRDKRVRLNLDKLVDEVNLELKQNKQAGS